jgi:uncharacterized membrane protein
MPLPDAAPSESSDVDRLARFSDVVFAVALGVLVLRIPVPEIYVESDRLHDALGDVVQELFGFGLTFLAIGMLWADHHRLFDRIERRTDALVWANLGFLMCVAFLPFPAAVLGKHLDAPVAILLFSGAMAVSGFAFAALTWWATRRSELLVRALAMPIVFVLAAPGADVIVPIRDSGVSLATLIWIVALPAARVLLSRRPQD